MDGSAPHRNGTRHMTSGFDASSDTVMDTGNIPHGMPSSSAATSGQQASYSPANGIPPPSHHSSSRVALSSGGANTNNSLAGVGSGSGGYASMTGAGFTLQQTGADSAMHPPGRAPTGGQSHSHRPVSAMPTPSTRNYYTPARQSTQTDANILSTMNNSSYAERRASAHPTVPNTSSQSHVPMASPLSPAGIDPATSNAIHQGVPITSPAALQYFAAHPRRQQVHFGNYLLLQTLGEGEFGKVKLGVHKEWGEEVAVKLIKRDKVGTPDGQLQITGPSKDPSKMSKVEKEIRVLKDVRHPNIVRLYEVIESDRYIGIVLEYASGGELFDHILAHKYLKERDACRLFAQLISGVSYLHQKKIVHRDLKLENLLLDRNRNVIITDFGFANNFENKRDDLMATSCGSPCYAAPELVVQDGLYAGSAVDVWSCGVILYAMLAGYLPFDDDPANPDGDNINLLYKYIMATPLSFPDYITAQPRDLLSRMLVPDPLKRADLPGVMAHSWLAPYRDLFKFSVEELERAAIEQQNKKRQVYRQQMLIQQQLQEQQRAGQRGVQGHSSDAQASVKQQRHQSAMAVSSTVPGRMYEPAIGSRSRPVTGMPTPRHVVDSPSVSSGLDARDDARDDGQTSSAAAVMTRGSQSNDGSSAVSKKSAGSKTQRHTVQLEYDSSAAASRRQRLDEDVNRTIDDSNSSVPPLPGPVPHVVRQESIIEDDLTRPPRSDVAVAQVPAVPVPVSGISTASRHASGQRSSKANEQSSNTEAPSTSTASHARRRSTASRIASNPVHPPSDRVVDFPVQPDRVVSGGPGPRPEQSERRTVEDHLSGTPSPRQHERIAKEEKAQARHRKGMSTDKFFLSKLLGTPSSAPTGDVLQQISGNNTTAVGADSEPKAPSVATSAINSHPASEPTGRRTSSSRRKAMSLVVGRANEASEKEREKSPKAERRLTARLRKETLTKDSMRPETPKRNISGTSSKPSPSAASVITNHSTSVKSSIFKRSNNGSSAVPFDHSLNESSSTVGASSNAAKKVMDWFRKKSLSRGMLDEKPPLGPFETQSAAASPIHSSHKQEGVSTASAANGQAMSEPGSAPQLIVTGDGAAGQQNGQAGIDSVPSSRSTSGTHSQTSQATHSTGVTSAAESSTNAAQRYASDHKSSTSTVHQQQATPRASASPMQRQTANGVLPDSALRIHQGAVDQSALTSRAPVDVFSQVQRTLWQLGVEAKKEGEEEFKLECVRRKRAKTLMGATQGLGLSIRTSVFPPSQADYERSSNSANARLPVSPSSTLSPSPSSMRNFLRRGSSQQSGVGASNPEEQMPPPLYGEPSVDGGQEVRFSVEVTRLKNLPGLYSVDIRRMKGNLWAYKFIYHALLDRCDLNGNAAPARQAVA